jgi:hypothetical protein
MTEARHNCVKEVELALLQLTVENTKESVDSLVKLLKDNGQIGLVSMVREQGLFCKTVQAQKAADAARENTLWVRFFQPVYNVAAVCVLSLIVAGTVVFFANKTEASRVAKLDTVMQKLERMELNAPDLQSGSGPDKKQ